MEARLGGVAEAIARSGLPLDESLLPPRPKKEAMAEPKDCACTGAAVPAIANSDPAATEIRVLETLIRIL